jgi:hypothetical protein
VKKSDIDKKLGKAKSDLSAAESELESLRQQVQELEAAAGSDKQEDGISKRDIFQAAWVAPVVMAVNLPNNVFAQSATSPVATPGTPTPTPRPTPRPTPNPTLSPTPSPTIT